MYRAFWGLVKKEFIQVFRDINMLRLIFAVPIIQLLLFGYVVNLDVKKIRLDVYDFDHTQLSRDFIASAKAGDYFLPDPATTPIFELSQRFQSFSSDMALIIPHGFSDKLSTNNRIKIGLVADGTDANQTSIGSGYLARIVQQYASRVTGYKSPVDLRFQVLYNPEAESVYFMVPGIVATLLTMITIMLTSMAIVREREGGTLEQLLVTPMSSRTLLFGKLFPFAVLGLIEMILALVFGTLWFKIPFAGSPVLLFSLSGLYLLTTLGLGLFISTVTSTQQQAMFFAWFFSVFAIMTSGFFAPIANMPQWMQYVTCINPMRYFLVIVRSIMMKGSGFMELLPQVYALIAFGVILFSFAVLRFHKRTA